MKKYTVDEPEFNKTLIITETTDTGHADNINKAPKMAFENTLYLEKTKLDADGGDISDAVIKAADEIEDDEYPIPASGDKPRTFLGKTKKFLGNIKDWMTGVCLLGQIVNNCVTDNAKLPLSAAQGKVLMDLYNVLNTKQFYRLINNVSVSYLLENSDEYCVSLYRTHYLTGIPETASTDFLIMCMRYDKTSGWVITKDLQTPALYVITCVLGEYSKWTTIIS